MLPTTSLFDKMRSDNWGAAELRQSFKFDYKPKLIDWLTTDFSYSANFRYYFVNLSKGQKQSSNRLGRRASASFSPSQLVNMIYTPDKEPSKNNKRNRGRRPRNTVKTDTVKVVEQKASQDTTKKKFKVPNPLMLVWGFFNSWKKIQTSYTWNQNGDTAGRRSDTRQSSGGKNWSGIYSCLCRSWWQEWGSATHAI